MGLAQLTCKPCKWHCSSNSTTCKHNYRAFCSSNNQIMSIKPQQLSCCKVKFNRLWHRLQTNSGCCKGTKSQLRRKIIWKLIWKYPLLLLLHQPFQLWLQCLRPKPPPTAVVLSAFFPRIIVINLLYHPPLTTHLSSPLLGCQDLTCQLMKMWTWKNLSNLQKSSNRGESS